MMVCCSGSRETSDENGGAEFSRIRLRTLAEIARPHEHDYHHILGPLVTRVRKRRCEMQVVVELFGIPRARAGIAQTVAVGSNLGDVLADLGNRFPQLAESCIDGRALRPGFIVNVGAERFVSAPETPLLEGETVLLLSLDAGG